MKISIKARFSDAILFEGEYESTKHAVLAALKARADLRRADLRGANLYGADLCGANLRGANLYGADLCGANLRGANLYGANLRGADLRGANLYGADLCGANLYGADLRGADLRGADLRGANLYGADLCGADLRGAKNELLEKIYINPIQITGLPIWEVLIVGSYMRIGCEQHKIKDWAKFKDSRISKMDTRASEWWAENKMSLLAIAEAYLAKHQAEVEKNPVESKEAA